MISPTAADIGVQLATALYGAINDQSSSRNTDSNPDLQRMQLQLPHLSSLIIAGADHLGQDTSLRPLWALALRRSGTNINNVQAPVISNSPTALILSTLLQACISSAGNTQPTHVLSTLRVLLHIEIPPAQPQAFLQSLCKVVAKLPSSISSQVLLLLPQAAVLCNTPLPPRFMQSYESTLAGNALLQQQMPERERGTIPCGAATTSVLLQDMQDAPLGVKDSAVAAQLVEIVFSRNCNCVSRSHLLCCWLLPQLIG